MAELSDIHCHVIYGVDDGARNLYESLEMLKKAASQGVGTVIATPHFRHEMFDYPLPKIASNFEELKEKAGEIGIKLYLGCEYHVNSDIIGDIRSHRVHTMCDTKFVLCEFSYLTEFEYMRKYVSELVSNGFMPIIAHAERYKVFMDSIYSASELKSLGAMIQVNCDSVLGLSKRILKKTSRNMLKYEIADFVASDAHGIDYRPCRIEKCYELISKKYSAEYADLLFKENPKKITDAIPKAGKEI